MGTYIEGLDMPKEHSLWMVIHPNGQVWMRKRHYCQNLEDVEATELDLVRCKECKNSHMTYDGKCKYCDLEKDDDDNFIECYFDGDHFCSDGERRSE